MSAGTTSRRRLGIALVTIVLAVGACRGGSGDSSDAGGDGSTPTTATGAAATDADDLALPADLDENAPINDDPAEGAAADDGTVSGRSERGGGPRYDESTEAVVDFIELPPVAIDQREDLGDGLFVEVTEVESVDLDARGAGQTAGPGVAVTLAITNERTADVDLDGMAVNATHDDRVPATPNYSDPSRLFSGTLAPGQTATAIYAFRVSDAERASLVVDVHHNRSPHIVLIEVGS